MGIKAVVFDFGGVLIDWSPEYVYRRLIPDDAERRWFLDNVCRMDWVVQQDGGQTIAEGTAELIAKFPAHEALIRAFYERWRAFYERWREMVAGVLEEGTVHTVNRPLAEDEPGDNPFTFSMVTAEGVSTVGSTFLPSAPDPEALAPQLVVHAARFVPALSGAAIVRSRVCARPQSIDGRPFIGAVEAALSDVQVAEARRIAERPLPEPVA